MQEQMPVTCDILIMLLKGPTEEVTSLSISDEIKVIGGRRVKCRAEGGFSWIGNGARRQAPVSVGVVRGLKMKVIAVELAVVGSSENQRVRDCGIALQRLAFAQTVFEHTRYVRPLLRARSLAFHE